MWEDAPFGAHFLPWFLLGILQPHQKHGRDCAPLSFAMNGVRGRRNRVNRAMLKLLWWLVKNIILLPFLPIRLGWKWGREAKIRFSGSKRDAFGNIIYEEVGGCLPRLVSTFISAGLMYYGIYKAVLYFIGK